MDKKRILIMAAHFHPYKGGLENFAVDLATKLAKKGIVVDVFTFNLNKEKSIEKYKGITIYRFPGLSILGQTFTFPDFNSKYSKMRGKIFTNYYDVVFTNTRFFTTSFLGMIYAKRLNTKFVHIEHGNVHVIHNNPFITVFAWLYDQIVARFIFGSADIVVGISNPCARFAKSLGAKRTTVIHNSIDAADFSKKNVSRRNLRIPAGNLVIINGIGRLIYAKGLQDTIDAVKGMKKVTVINMGEGPYKDELKRLSKENKIHSIFPGRISRDKIVEYLSVADIFVNPSYSEGLPTCVLEAGAAGVSVIATNVGGTKEIVTNTKEGLLVSPRNPNQIRKSINYLLKNKNEAKEMSKKLTEKIKNKFDWSKNISKFEELI